MQNYGCIDTLTMKPSIFITFSFAVMALGATPLPALSQTPEVLWATHREEPRFVAVKTNAIPWAMTVMNIEGEVQVHPHISVSLPLWWCPWFVGESHALRILALQPEGRWWLKAPGDGHFFGPHLTVAWYNLRKGDIRYQDCHRPLLGAGLTYGYSFHLTPHWGIELAIGAGWFTTEYDRFHNVYNGARIDSRRTSYWGIDHASISVSYRFML